ncbi:MAG: acetyl-CoA carboxylase carboxyltransferase subunit alpha [Clostridia bacterium]|nr:acetyl-CoA carboxylase carboxyltransferase subunit alpha [Clostridia bacterium]
MSKRKSAWDRVNIARAQERPSAKQYIDRIFDKFMELHGDRNFGDDHAIIGGIAMLDGKPVTVIAVQKGENTKDNIYRNFGCPHPEGYRKALRLMLQAEKFNRPIVCLVDTQGAYCGVGAEERGQGEAIAKNLMTMINLKVPIISVVIGQGGSGGALALAVADEVWMLENSIYSILSPEGFSSILWKDSSRAREAADVMKLTAEELLKLKVIDKVIAEPKGNASKDIDAMSTLLKDRLIDTFERLCKLSKDELLLNRYEKYRKIGHYKE